MDWNPLTWTFATTFFGISLLKWGLVIGGIIFLALLRKFLLASVRSSPHEGNVTQTPSAHAHTETKTVASTLHQENMHPNAAPVVRAQMSEATPSQQVVAVKEFKQAVVVAKQKRKSSSKKPTSKPAATKTRTSKKIPAPKKVIVTAPAEATSALAPNPIVRPQPSAKPLANTRTEGIVITDSIISERKANARTATATTIATPPASTPQKINSTPVTAAPAKKAKAIVKKKVAKKKKIPVATEAVVVSPTTTVSTTTPSKKESAKAETVPLAAQKVDFIPEKKAAAKNNVVKKKLVKKIVTKAVPEKQSPLQKITAPETKSTAKTDNEKSPAPTGKPVRMRNPGFI